MIKKFLLLMALIPLLLLITPTLDTFAANDSGIVDIEETTSSTTEDTEDADVSTYSVSGSKNNNSGSNSGSSATTESELSEGEFYIDDNGNIQVNSSITTEGFFKRIQNKLIEAFTGFKSVALVIIMIIFLVLVVCLCFSLPGEGRRRVPGLCVGILICLLCFVMVMYAPEIISAFSNWFVTD